MSTISSVKEAISLKKNPKYDSDIKKSFKFFETFIKAKFKTIGKAQDY